MTWTPDRRPDRRRRRHRYGWWLLLTAFVLVPLVEIYVIIQVGQVIGPWWTILLLIADSVFGSWLVRHEGGRAWQALTDALQNGRMPAKELSDGALILVGGTLMIAPGFVTDVFGILMILPFTRPLGRAALSRIVSRRLVLLNVGGPGPGPQGPVVRGEVIDDDRS